MRFSVRTILLLFASLLLAAPTWAGQPKGKAKGKGKEKVKAEKMKHDAHEASEKAKAKAGHWKDGTPPGWSRGKKKGWNGADVPPGWAKKSPDEKKSFLTRMEKIQKRLREKAGEAEGGSVDLSVEETARKGLPLEKIEALIEKALDKGLSPDEIEQTTRAVAEGASEEVGAEELAEAAEALLDGDVKGPEVARGVYKYLGKKLGVE